MLDRVQTFITSFHNNFTGRWVHVLAVFFFLIFTSLFVIGMISLVSGLPDHPVFWNTLPIDTTNLRKQGSYSYVAQGEPSCSARILPSPCLVLEDGEPLPGTPNAIHVQIQNQGLGSSSFWDAWVLFATSDNSDPSANGRVYAYKKPVVRFYPAQVTFFGLIAYGLYVVIHHLAKRVNHSDDPGKQNKGAEKTGAVFPAWLSGANTWGNPLFLLVPVLLYFLILFSPFPLAFYKGKQIYSFMAAAAVLAFTIDKTDFRNRVITQSVIAIMVAISIAGVWSNATPRYNAVGGLIPWSDAHGYYEDAYSISSGRGVFYSTIANRTLHTASLAVLLSLTNWDLKLSLAIIGLAWVAVIYALSREVETTFGNKSGLIVAMLAIIFHNAGNSGAIVSENTGFLLGGIGASALLAYSRQSKLSSLIFGVLLITLGLNARSGAYLVLPALVFWAGLAHADRFSWRKVLLSGGIVLTGFLINRVIVSAFAIPNTSLGYGGMMISVMLWGLVTNHIPDDVHSVFPGIKNAQYSDVLFPIVIETVRKDPLQALANILKPFTAVFPPDGPLFLGFGAYTSGFRVFSVILYGLLIVGFAGCLYHFRKPKFSLLVCALIGILASVPLASYVGYRAQAVTLPFVFCVMGAGFAFVNRRLLGGAAQPVAPQPAEENANKLTNGPQLFEILAIIMLTCILTGPFLLKTVRPAELSNAINQCKEGELLTIPPLKNSYIRLTKEVETYTDRVPNVNVSTFIRNRPAADAGYPGFAQAILELKPGMALFHSPNHKDVFILFSSHTDIVEELPATVCVSPYKNVTAMYRVKTYQSIPDANRGRRIVFGVLLAAIYSVILSIYFLLTKYGFPRLANRLIIFQKKEPPFHHKDDSE